MDFIMHLFLVASNEQQFDKSQNLSKIQLHICLLHTTPELSDGTFI